MLARNIYADTSPLVAGGQPNFMILLIVLIITVLEWQSQSLSPSNYVTKSPSAILRMSMAISSRPALYIPTWKACPASNRSRRKMGTLSNKTCIPLLVILLLACCFNIEAQQCLPSGRIKGKNPPPEKCNPENDSECCKAGKYYPTYTCSPPVTTRTKAHLTINSFEKGGDGGGPSECDNQYHSDDKPIVALSTGWFSNKDRCFNNITISANGHSVVAMVVDECDSTMGCDDEHDYQPPCANNIVDASKAVWKALGVPHNDWGGLDITWSEA